MKRLIQPAAYFTLILVLAAAAVAQQVSIRLPADEATPQLKAGPGEELVRSRCALCHSLDYVLQQPPLTAPQWEGEVRKMLTNYGAPLTELDVKTVSGYLAKNYGAPAAPATPPRPARPPTP